MISILKSKKTKIKETEASLKGKLQKMLSDLNWTNYNFEIKEIVKFFNYIESQIGTITEKEFEVAPEGLKNFVQNTGRDQYGWFRAPQGETASVLNTYIQPTGHFDEYFHTHNVKKLMDYEDKPSDQGGFAKRDMTTREFYLEAFVKPFIKGNTKHLESLVKEL